MSDSAHFMRGLLTPQQFVWWPMFVPPIVVTALLIFGLDAFPWDKKTAWKPVVLTAGIVVLIALALLNAAQGSNPRPFIYGRF